MSPLTAEPIRVVQYGIGPIGREAVRAILDKQPSQRVCLVGAIDIDPDKVGRDVADLLDRSAPSGIVVRDDAEVVLADTKPDVVIHTTSSFLDQVEGQLVQCAEAGAHVVSSTEELSFPYARHAGRAEKLDEVARRNGVVIVGTGVNPGYAMDTLALMATGVCVDVDAVLVERVVDASERRLPLQQKVGAGISETAFAEKKATGTFGHIGLRESLLLLADGLGWALDVVEETLDPMIAERHVETPFLTVEAGDVAGIHHAVIGSMNGKAVLTLDLKMYVGAEDPSDAVQVRGNPPIDMKIRNGIFGDTATVGALVNTVPLVLDAKPGLRTMKDLPVPRAFATSALATHA